MIFFLGFTQIKAENEETATENIELDLGSFKEGSRTGKCHVYHAE